MHANAKSAVTIRGVEVEYGENEFPHPSVAAVQFQAEMPSSPCLSRRSPSYYDANDDTGFVLFIQLCCSLYLAIIR